jgi:nucleotide-binding universal stress UspA family protein
MKPFKNILCVLTPSQTCKAALERAVSLAENNQARLTVVDVVERIAAGTRMQDGEPMPGDLQTMVNSDHLRTLETFTTAYRQRVEIRHDVLTGTGFIEIIRTVLRNEHDLVIKPAENPSFVERIFGSDDMQLLRKCPCPVWLTQPTEKSSYDCIMAAVDFDPLQPETVGRGLNMEILGTCRRRGSSGYGATTRKQARQNCLREQGRSIRTACRGCAGYYTIV